MNIGIDILYDLPYRSETFLQCKRTSHVKALYVKTSPKYCSVITGIVHLKTVDDGV